MYMLLLNMMQHHMFDCYDIGRELTSPLPQKFLKNKSCIKCRFNLQIKTDTKLHNCGELSASSRLFTASASSVSRMFFLISRVFS